MRPWTCIPIVKESLSITKEERKCYKIIHSFTEKVANQFIIFPMSQQFISLDNS
jgi:hypothetical protein